MKRLIAPLLLAIGLGFGAAPTSAQDAPADPLVDQAREVLRQIDDGRTDAVWDAAAPFLKARLSRPAAADGFRASRAKLGTVVERKAGTVKRVSYAEATPEHPAGVFGSVDFESRLADGRTGFELLSFRLEDDGVWRLAGYVPRALAAPTPTAAAGPVPAPAPAPAR